MNRNPRHENDPLPQPGEFEIEAGVQLPGIILPPEQWTQTGIKKLPDPQNHDWTQNFGRSAPLVVELGCGNGRFAVSSAVRHPEWDHLAVDILPMVIRYATRRGNQRGLKNVRFLVCGGLEFLENYFGEETIHQLHIYHPQPFREPGQEHKRLLTPEFFVAAHRRLESGGALYFQTDNPAYWQHFLGASQGLFEVHEVPGAWPEDPLGRTRREIVAKSQGLPIFRAIASKPFGATALDYQSYLAQAPQPKFDALKHHPQRSHRSSDPRRRRRRKN